MDVETTSGVKFEIGEKITFLWVIDFIWLKELFFYALYANKFRDLKACDGLAHIFFYQLCYAGKFCAKKWMMKYFKFSLLECMFICIKMHQLIAASFQAVELSCFKVKAKNSINHFCIGAGKKKPHLYELPSQINLDIFIFCHLTV